MTSIVTNSSAIAALATLRTVNAGLAKTQLTVSTGYRVDKASDNAAYWSVATTMRSDNKALSAVQDAIGMGAAVVDTAYEGMQSVISVTSEIKAKLVAATETGVDKTKINEEISQLKDQLRATISSASFNGQNWLMFGPNDDPPAMSNPQIPGSFTRSSNGTVSVTMLNYNWLKDASHPNRVLVDESKYTHGAQGILTDSGYAARLGLSTGYLLLKRVTPPGTKYSALPLLPQVEIGLTATTTTKDVTDMVSVVDSMLTDITSAAATLGSMSKRVQSQADFVSTLRDSIQSGIGRLVDANMEEESSRLSALQTQQQLGIQSLSIANGSTQSLLTLFR
jgi:flagellin